MSNPKAAINPLFLRDEDLRQAIELLFFAYRDFTSRPDAILAEQNMGRAHHRVIYFVGRHPGMSVSELLDILAITKQSLSRVLSQLVREGFILQKPGTADRRQRLLHLTEKGRKLESDLTTDQRARMAAAYKNAGAVAVEGFRKVMFGIMDAPARNTLRPAMAEASIKPTAYPPHVLVIDDDARLRDLLAKFLTKNSFMVSTAADLGEARRQLSAFQFDLLIVDVMMPGENGLALTKSIRENGVGANGKIPILMLTAMGETRDRITGLETGVDDYMSKPFEPRELVLRVNSILRRAPPVEVGGAMELRFGDCRYDLARQALTRGGEPVHLTAGEAELLSILARSVGTPVDRSMLATTGEEGANPRTIDVQITRLRRKIEPDPRQPRYLQTVRGTGYLLRAD